MAGGMKVVETITNDTKDGSWATNPTQRELKELYCQSQDNSGYMSLRCNVYLDNNEVEVWSSRYATHEQVANAKAISYNYIHSYVYAYLGGKRNVIECVYEPGEGEVHSSALRLVADIPYVRANLELGPTFKKMDPPKIKESDPTLKFVNLFESYEDRLKDARTRTEPDPDKSRSDDDYVKGSFTHGGLLISIETPKGGIRKGTDCDGEDWEVKLKHDYGEIKRTESDADGDPVDCFIGPESDWSNVFVVNQKKKKKKKKFDEHKVMLGFGELSKAKEGYLSAYNDGWDGILSIKEFSLDQFHDWLKNGDTSRAIK